MIDFLIIGGGIAGISAAARLASLGRTTVLEAEQALAYHASGRSAAMFEESYGQRATIALNKASKAFHETTAEVLSPRGMLLIGRDDNTEAFNADRATMKLEDISIEDAAKMVPILNPDVVTRAAHHADAWDIDTDKLIQHFAKVARGHGVQISTHSLVTQITKLPSGWEVNTKHASYFARNIVNAAGAWADQVAELAGIAPLGLQPYRRSMARLPAPGEMDVSTWPMLFGPGETWYAKPDAGALIVSPADEDPVDPHDAFAEEMTLAKGLMRYEDHMTKPVVRLLANWAGLRTFAPDRNLVLGPDDGEASFIWCAGQGGYGMQTAPAASQLLADLVSGAMPDLDAASVMALSARRFER